MLDEPEGRDDPDAAWAEELWENYYTRLRAAVRQRVRGIRRASASESEVAQSALRTFLRRVQQGQLPRLDDDSELWRLLKTIAIRKSIDLQKNLRAQKRGGHYIVYNQDDQGADPLTPQRGVANAPDTGPSPAADLEISELFNSMLASLPDDRHRDLILLKLQGASVALIAEHLGVTTRTVQRMVKGIEQQWQGGFLER